MADASRDANFVPTLLGVSNADGTTPVKVYADPTTHRLLVDSAGGGTVTSVSVVSANGLAGTVATATTTPAITLSTTITGVLKGNGTAISAGVAGDVDSILPTQTANSGKFLTTNGTNSSWATVSGSGTVNSGTAGQIAYYASSTNAVSGNANITISSSALTLGVAGSAVGTLLFANATSGAITLTPPTGALTGTLTLPNATDTLIGKATTDTLTNKTYDTAGTGNVLKINGTGVSAVTGTGAVVLATSPTLTTAVLGSSTATTQTPSDNSTKVATTAYVDAAVLGQNFKEAAKYATTAALASVVYSNGSSGVGATLTGVATGVLTVDGNTVALNDRVLVKNEVTGANNGIYLCTIAGAIGVAYVLTRATDSDQTTDWKTGDSNFVTSGTALSTTTWAYTGIDSPTIGTTALTFVQTAGQGSFTAGNGIAITGVSIAIDTAVTVDKTTAQTLTNKTLTSPTLTTPTLGVASATTINKVTLTAPATGSTLTIADGKTLTVNNSITLAGTDSTTMTFPSTSATVGGLAIAQTWTAQNKFNNIIDVNNAVSVTTNAGTVPVTSRLNTFTNSSAATMAITMATASAVDGQMTIVRIYDFSAVAQTIGWTNTENSTVTAPTTSNGSTTLPLTVGFMFNSATTKWRCIASA